MRRFLLQAMRLGLLFFSLTAIAFGQTAVEYGIIGSKPPPKSPDAGRSVNEKIQSGLKQTPSSGQGYRRQTERQPKGGGNTGGPLIIEQRGGHYERVN
jgi:hypothetical protein